MTIDSRARVFIVNYAGHDLSDLARYTDQPLILLTTGKVQLNAAVTYDIAQKLFTAQYCAAHDYLVVSGSAGLAATVMAILKETFEAEQVKVLVYVKATESYSEKVIDGYYADFALETERQE